MFVTSNLVKLLTEIPFSLGLSISTTVIPFLSLTLVEFPLELSTIVSAFVCVTPKLIKESNIKDLCKFVIFIPPILYTNT